MPSPTIATAVAPQLANDRGFGVGRHASVEMLEPSSAAMRAATRRLSPVTTTGTIR
jgi:hypothetical protein